MNLKFLHNPEEIALVDFRREKWEHAMWCTISPNPKVVHEVYLPLSEIKGPTGRGRKKTYKMPYGKMRQKDQYDYCIKYLANVYNNTLDSKVFGVWELNSNGDVHLHFIMSDPKIIGPTGLDIFRRDVFNCRLTILNLSGKTDYMNNINFVTDSVEERLEYMSKDMDENFEIFPYFCTMNALKVPLIVEPQLIAVQDEQGGLERGSPLPPRRGTLCTKKSITKIIESFNAFADVLASDLELELVEVEDE